MARKDNIPDEKVMSQLRKIAELAERGYMGEAEMARRMLEEKLARYGLTIEDLSLGHRRRREFGFATKDEYQVFVNFIAHRFGSKSPEWDSLGRYERRKVAVVDLVDVDFPDVSAEWGYYRDAFRREKKANESAFRSAFIHRFNLFDIAPDKERHAPEMTADEINRIVAIMCSIKAEPYRREITDGGV